MCNRTLRIASLCLLLAYCLSRAYGTPQFAGDLTETNAVVIEDAEIGDTITGVSVIDLADSSYPGPAMADIELQNNNEGLFDFNINGLSVIITVKADLSDRIGTYDLEVVLLATDTLIIHIEVRQSNFPPIFFSTHYFAVITEEIEVDDVVIATIEAIDFDAGTNGVIEYAFENPTEISPPMGIDPITGVITLSQTIDYDTGQTSFEFNVIAQETLTATMLSVSTIVHVIVVNVNDHAPMFPDSPTVYEYTVTENTAAALLTTSNGLTTTITATDGDADGFGDVTYSLTGSSLFGVEMASGSAQLKTLAPLNREVAQVYRLTLIARDGGTPPLADTVQLQVTVQDVNDVPPVFGVTEYRITLSEDDSLDHSNFVVFHATDGDAEAPNNEVTYTTIERTDIVGGDNPFVLNPDTGAVSVSGVNLDFETDTTYTLSITASDGGTPAMTALATLIITVLSVNEHPPVFDMLMYAATILESHTIDTGIGLTVAAADNLEGHTVEFSIDHTFQDGDFFDIDATTGALTLVRSLDKDPPTGHDVFTFFVVATDIPPAGETQVRLSAEVQVDITVSDVNDNAPIITNPDQSLVRIEVFEERETLAIDLFVMVANDIDGDSDGDSIVYSLSASDASLSFFSLGSTSGIFQQTAQVDREACTPAPCHYEMTASACDQATTPMCSTLDVTVTVLDVNDNPPVVTTSPLTASTTVPECMVDGRLLSTVTAEDTVDTGDNAEVAYETVSGDTAHIVLNTGTGQLNLGFQALDYETGPLTFSLTVRARDNPDGSAADQLPSADSFTQTVQVGDCNDEAPVFTDTVYEFSVVENTAAGTTLTGPTISSTDADATAANRAVTYRVTAQGTDLNWLDINPSSGEIFIRAGETVDREDTALLIDNDGNGVLIVGIQAVNAAPTGTLTSAQNAQVVVRIGDQNDNPPIMDAVPLSGSEAITILESIPVNTIVAVVRATDADVGNNAHIQYEISSGNGLGKFSIDEDTGVVNLEQAIDFEVDPLTYTITITAINDLAAVDPPDTDQDEITLIISIEGTNEHAPQFDQLRYDRVIFEHNGLITTQQHMEGDVIATVSATDPDTGANHEDIHYSITGGNEDGIFEIIEPTMGNVMIKNPEMVDYETTTSYALLITATDLVIPTSERKINTTYLYIEVTDVNDNVPVLSSDAYTGFINEEEPDGSTVILVNPITAEDADSLGGTETLTFDIMTVGDPQPEPFLAFTLSADGTSLTTTTTINREASGNSFTFQITVMDLASNMDTAMVTIDIVDINDNAPEIQETAEELFITIPENHPVDSVIATLSAEDIDLAANAEFSFVMQGGAGYFEININSGVVKLVASVQALEPPFIFPLTVYAIDSGGLNSSLTFMVNLTYSNDHAPIFNPTLYFGSIVECATDGTDTTPAITVSATDDDSNSMLRYYLESGDTGMLFRLDRRGAVANILANGNEVYDRETADTLRFAVFATDDVSGTDDDFANITVTVLDCNDNNPIFTQAFYEVDVYEGTVTGSTVIQVHTNDADIDENAEVRFSVDSVEPPSLTDVFRVDPESGGIVTNLDITNEYTGTSTCSSLTVQTNSITLMIQATDQATQQPQLSNYTTVYIRLLDRNSDAPSFQPSNFYSFDIPENIENVDVGTVLATDECDQNSVVTYHLVAGDDSSPFEIDENTGIIHLLSSLDREANDLLVIQLEATDDGTDPGPQTGFASLSIQVLDENDNAPELVKDEFELAIPESIPVGTTLITLSASDPDLGENSTLTYRITEGDTNLFGLANPAGSTNDHLVTITELDRETQVNYIVRLIVEDGGLVPKSDTAVMNLTLTDVNDNEPVWTAGHGTTFDITEGATSMMVVDLDAVDTDEGINSQLVYFFVGGSQNFGPFFIDRRNGSVYLQGELDYEDMTQYILSIAVADRNGGTAPDDLTVQQNTTTVTINVVDINDNLPYFTKCPHTFEILEDLADGSVVGGEMVSSVNDLDTIENPFYFYLVNEEDVECNEAFCIDQNTGEITLDGDIDYEKAPMYTFYVVVSDRPNLSPLEAYSSPTIDLCDTVATQNNNLTRVDVSLVDINDQTPTFVADSLLTAVAEEADFDTTITTIRATDADTNSTFSTVYYEIVAIDPPYLVDRETGAVTTADVFTDRSGEVDRFTIIAYDNEGEPPSFTSTSVLTVRVFKESQQIIAVVDQTKEEAENCRPLLEEAIANETGHIIYTTKIRVFQDEEQGVVDTTKSDVIFYALDRTTGELVEPQEVINVIERALDLREEPVNSAFQTCFVLEVKPFSRTTTTNNTTQSISLVIGIVIGILGAIILGLCCCLLCVCALERRKARKLRVKKKSHEQSSQFSHFSQVATSNPIWVPPYEQWEEESTTTANQSTALDRENPLYESQELTIEMFQDDEEDLLSIASSRGNLAKTKPPKLSSTPAHDSHYDDYDPLADALGISSKRDDSKTSLI